MVLIFKTKNFIVEAVDKPHIDRDDGGHIRISPKIHVVDRQHLPTKLAIELMRLTVVVGEAMTTVMNKRGIDIGRINYQDNGNWSVFKPEGPYLHYHLYGRAKSAKYQKYGEAGYFPLMETNPKYYARFKPLNNGDIKGIKKEIDRLLKTKKYSDPNWGLS
jgi:diadenosine tetraphosphate (Ap4A) HIT family hydrolase